MGRPGESAHPPYWRQAAFGELTEKAVVLPSNSGEWEQAALNRGRWTGEAVSRDQRPVSTRCSRTSNRPSVTWALM